MNTLESLVPSLEVCQQLKEAGFPQDTALYWQRSTMHVDHPVSVHVKGDNEMGGIEDFFEDICSAPTAEELDDWLLCNDCDNILVKNESADGENAVGVSCIHSDGRDFEAHEATEIAARSALVLEVMT